jgi:aminoglycoside phosphotransferase family enzyme/predicted kinase
MELEPMIEALSNPSAYERKTDRVEVRQTHISVVFLVGPLAYKIKKPLRLSFLDYSTLERRRHFCDEEVRLNRRLAPQVYRGVVAVTQDGSQLRMEGSGEVVEWAVKMERLPEQATLRAILDRGEVGAGQIEGLGRRIANFHARAERNERITELSRFENVARLAQANFTESAGHVGSTLSARVFHRLSSLNESALAALKPWIEERVQRRIPCDTHGDLRLDHVYLFPDRAPPGDVVIVDGIEFNETFRAADPVADMAFLAMELIVHDRRDLAGLFRDAYVAASGDHQVERLLPFYVAYRAAVRGKVEGMKAAEPEITESDRASSRVLARAHWLVALGALEEPGDRPCLVLVGGLPGIGKSTLSRDLAAAAGFRLIRSDQVRKELARSAGEASRPAGFEDGIYSPDWSDRTYQACLERALAELQGGRRVLVDATFREESRRRSFLELARNLGVPGILLICQADPRQVQARLASRRQDLSDADWSIYLQSARIWEPVGAGTEQKTFSIDTGGEVERAVERAREVLREQGLLS